MRGGRLCLIALVVLLSSLKSSAQSTSYGRETYRGEVDVTEVANYELAHPVPVVRKPPFDEDEFEDGIPKHRPAKGAMVHMIRRNTERSVNDSTGPDFLTASQAPDDTFLSTLSSGANIPADAHGAVDSYYCVTAINPTFHVQNRLGKTILTESLDVFWQAAGVLPSGTGSFDPRIHFDPYLNRWIMISDAVTSGSMDNSYLLIAVSKTSNPTGKWWAYAIATDPTNAAWLDYPCIGFNNKWIVVSGNFFKNTTGGQTGAAVYAFDYAAIRAGTGATYKKFSEPSSFTIAPALMYDPTEPNLFAVETWNAGAGQLQMWKLSGAVASPTFSKIGNPSTTTHWRSAEPMNTDFAPQATITSKFDLGDHRISNAVYRNGKVWCSHNVFLPTSGSAATRCSVMWWQIDTLANPLQNGMIDNATGPQFYAYPSITANQYDDALIGFSHFSSANYADAGYALHLHTDPANTMESVNIYRHGQASYFQNFGSGKNRWGDYSATCIDPRNHTDFWTIQESVPFSPANYWDTWWAYVIVCGANSKFTLAADTVEALTNDVLTFTGTAATGTVYTWIHSGGGAFTPGTGAGPQTFNWTSSGWKIITLGTTVNGCTTWVTDSVYVKKDVGVNNVNVLDNNIRIVPNPNEGSFSVLFDNPVNKKVIIKVTDLQGRVVYNNDFGLVSGNKIPVITNNLSTGNYIVTILTDNDEITKKIIISR